MTNQLYGNDIRFETQLNYCNSLMQKISEIQFSLRRGMDCTREFSNLMSLLTNGIKEPILPELKRISEKYDARVQILRNKTDFPETSYRWSGRHKEKVRGVMINREQSDAIREMLPVIINQLDKMNLLLNRENKTQI
jgi:hypothetical protein